MKNIDNFCNFIINNDDTLLIPAVTMNKENERNSDRVWKTSVPAHISHGCLFINEWTDAKLMISAVKMHWSISTYSCYTRANKNRLRLEERNENIWMTSPVSCPCTPAGDQPCVCGHRRLPGGTDEQPEAVRAEHHQLQIQHRQAGGRPPAQPGVPHLRQQAHQLHHGGTVDFTAAVTTSWASACRFFALKCIFLHRCSTSAWAGSSCSPPSPEPSTRWRTRSWPATPRASARNSSTSSGPPSTTSTGWGVHWPELCVAWSWT